MNSPPRPVDISNTAILITLNVTRRSVTIRLQRGWCFVTTQYKVSNDGAFTKNIDLLPPCKWNDILVSYSCNEMQMHQKINKLVARPHNRRKPDELYPQQICLRIGGEFVDNGCKSSARWHAQLSNCTAALCDLICYTKPSINVKMFRVTCLYKILNILLDIKYLLFYIECCSSSVIIKYIKIFNK